MAGLEVGAGVIRQGLFGVTITVWVATTMLVTLVFARSFQEGITGLRQQQGTQASEERRRHG